MTIVWVKGLTLEYSAVPKMMVAKGKTLRYKASRKYEAAHLCTPYRMVVLRLNRIFGRADGSAYKFGWIPLVYHVTIMGTIFNWADIVENSFSSCITAAQEGLHQRKSEFYMGSFMVDYILCFHPFEKLNCKWKGEKAPIYAAYHIL